jgi:hypothetical protein
MVASHRHRPPTKPMVNGSHTRAGAASTRQSSAGRPSRRDSDPHRYSHAKFRSPACLGQVSSPHRAGQGVRIQNPVRHKPGVASIARNGRCDERANTLRMHYRGMQHRSMHRENNHRGKQQPRQNAELHVGPAAQKTVPVAQMFGHRHHHQQQCGQQDKHTTQWTSPLAIVPCTYPVPHVANGCQCALTSVPNYVSARSNHVFSLTHSGGHVEADRSNAACRVQTPRHAS